MDTKESIGYLREYNDNGRRTDTNTYRNGNRID